MPIRQVSEVELERAQEAFRKVKPALDHKPRRERLIAALNALSNSAEGIPDIIGPYAAPYDIEEFPDECDAWADGWNACREAMERKMRFK